MLLVEIPAQRVSAGHGVPGICARHGLRATERHRLRLASRPPVWTILLALPGIAFAIFYPLQLVSRPTGWMVLLVLVGLAFYPIVVLALRKTVIAPAWPFCDECRADRAAVRTIGSVVLGAGVVGFVVSVIAAGPLDLGLGWWGMFLSIFVLLGALVTFTRTRLPVVARAQVSADGRWVQVSACELFARAATARAS